MPSLSRQVALPLLPLLILMLCMGCSSADGSFLASGWSVNDSSVNYDTHKALSINTSCSVLKLRSHKKRKPHLLQVNIGRHCMDEYKQVEIRDSFPRVHYEAQCFCPQNTNTNTFTCQRIRVPVTVLLKLSTAQSNASHQVLLLETRLLPAGCAPVSRPPKLPGGDVQRLTGGDLRHLGQTVGSPILQPVFCPREGSRQQQQPMPIYRVSIDSNRRPRLLADANCICPGQVPVRLPISVMRLVSQNNEVRQEWTNIGTSCAVLSP